MKKSITYVVGENPTQPNVLRRLSVGVRAALNGQKVFIVPNQSMVSTLSIHDVVPLDESTYLSASVQRGDIVVYRSVKHGGVLLPSRVIGLQNETIEIRNRKLHIDGAETPEPYIDADLAAAKHSRTLGAILVPQGHVFLMGDFRDLSEDSRFIGPVHQNLLVGRIVIMENK